MMTERRVTVEVPFEGSMRKAISSAGKLLYSQEMEDEYVSQMISERKGDKVICSMIFRKKKEVGIMIVSDIISL